jgi:hypothetical protein
LKLQVIKRIIELPSLKNTYQWRKVGFDMFSALADAKGEEGFKNEPNILRIIITMCTDTNWRIRL